MLSLCLDTNTYNAHRRGDPQAIALIAAVDQLWFPATVLGELRAGFVNGTKQAENELQLRRFLDLPYVAITPSTDATSHQYAAVHHQLKRAGCMIPVNDIWIAACALEQQCPLFTFDAHFQQVQGLQVVTCTDDWLKLP